MIPKATWEVSSIPHPYGDCLQIHIPNFPKNVSVDYKTQSYIGELKQDSYGFIYTGIRKIKTVEYFCYNLCLLSNDGFSKYDARFKMGILNYHHPKKQFPEESDFSKTHYIKLSDIMKKDSGFLTNGKLTIDVKLCILALIPPEKIRKFNFESCCSYEDRFKYFSVESPNNKKTYYMSPELVMFHDEFAPRKLSALWNYLAATDECPDSQLIDFLQIFHGVRWKYEQEELNFMGWMSLYLQAACFQNVHTAKICDQELTFLSIEWPDSDFPSYIDNVLVHPYGRHLLKALLRRVDSLKWLNQIVKKESVDGYCSETLKTLALKYFSFIE